MKNARFLSQLLSPAMFRKIVRENDCSLYERQISKYLTLKFSSSNLSIVQTLYQFFRDEYRCEYLYKNELFLKLVQKYRLPETLFLNEFKIGTSKADLIMLNGSVRIYEIKTEYDDFSKLLKQITDYQKFASKVYIVSDEKNAKKLLKEYVNSSIGIIVLNKNNELVDEKNAEDDKSHFEFDTIFKLLRKQEYLDIFCEQFNYMPDVPNTQIYKYCYNKLHEIISVEEFQNVVLKKLKTRGLQESNMLEDDRTPVELRYICNALNFNRQEYYKLHNFLKSKAVCISHI